MATTCCPPVSHAAPLKDSPRWFDLPVALVGLIVLSPVLLLIALLVKLTSRGPVIYKGRRVGKGGREFYIYKFRTMVDGADRLGPAVTCASDPRITPVGRWLRRFKLDELPQLVNVLKGDMAFVGPRPEDPRFVQYYGRTHRALLEIRPGITSPATVAHRREEDLLAAGQDVGELYVRTILPRKLEIDLAYFARRTVWSDLRVILGTLFPLAAPHAEVEGGERTA